MGCAKFRKKPVVIEAFNLGRDIDPAWFMDACEDGRINIYPNEHYCLIKTLEGEMRGEYGDWIIKGVNGELYPCKADIFEKSYDEVKPR